ncbi:MAG: CPBP family intramembrane glutamic endopeptidase [Polyangiales bacterium]
MPPPPLYVRPTALRSIPHDEAGPVSADSATLVLNLGELDLSETTPVATAPGGKFVGLGDGIDNSPSVRDAVLAHSPDPALTRWSTAPLRLVGLLAPLSWGYYVASEWRGVVTLTRDASRVIDSPEFKAAEVSTENPGLAKEARARRGKIERAIGMRTAYVVAEAGIFVVAVLVLAIGLRRWRAIPVALGFGAAFWWLFQAGRPGTCFGGKAWLDWLLAAMGLGAAVFTLWLAPTETRIARDLRARLGLPGRAAGEKWLVGERRFDVAAALAAVAAGLVLPVVITTLAKINAGNFLRIFVFVGFCSVAFLGFLSWRKDTSRVAPTLVSLMLAATLGFGVLAAADVAVRASFATVVEVQTCAAPDKVTALNKVQEQGSKETTAARKDTQTDVLAFFIAVFAAPLSEEMLYRGALQRVARKAFGGRWAIVLSGVVFGLAHMGAFHAAFYQHIGLGLAFAAVFELAGGGAAAVVASATTHLMWNLWLAEMPVF